MPIVFESRVSSVKDRLRDQLAMLAAQVFAGFTFRFNQDQSTSWPEATLGVSAHILVRKPNFVGRLLSRALSATAHIL